MKTLGICLGASTISIVEVIKADKVSARVLYSRRHEGNPRNCLMDALGSLPLKEYNGVAATGRRLCNFLNISVISEPQASEYAVEYINSNKEHFDALVSCGGETFMAYSLDKAGRISGAYTGSKCASGTGEFFLQQIRRMDLEVKEAITAGRKCKPFKVASRCSVFCKSDCTHALNRGEPKERVVSGLSEMIAIKIIELLYKIPKDKILLVGGVSRNSVVLDYLNKEIKRIHVPEEACYFEALGAALWAQGNEAKALDPGSLFKNSATAFSFLPALRGAENLVTFKELELKQAHPGDECILGLDVGSTTTKAVLMRVKDDAILTSVYLRTLGQPVEAARKCYQDFLGKLPAGIRISGLGVTGSGRYIAGLHALTRDVINEIIAHATAAAFFDKDVDTIFEIGGQDAKYTHLVNGVACDYAMNEACSAGTGSFLEESCKETLGIAMEEISDIALKSKAGPNFSDQCAAFISTDIKTAVHEGIQKEDIVAGLAYSICMNYLNRVKGWRPTGNKIFMQGGVCYIKAVPLAMATLINKPIYVAPHPGLMGAFGVALEVKNRIKCGLSKKENFSLAALAARSVEYAKPFICQGEQGECDRRCQVEVVKIEGKAYPFGGACNKYYNKRLDLKVDTAGKDLVNIRHKFLLEGYDLKAVHGAGKTIGINLSFLFYSLFPLYRTFFEKLGLKVVIPDNVREEALLHQGSAFCYPAGAAHGYFLDLVHKRPDYLFLPQVTEIPVKNSVSTRPEHQSTCHILQAEPYYLKNTFKHQVGRTKVLTPVLNFSQGYHRQEKNFLKIAKELGRKKSCARSAYNQACAAHKDFNHKLKKKGTEFLEYLSAYPQETAIVLFGRFYNAFSPELNLNIPHKFSSRGIIIIPFEFLPYEFEPCPGPQEFITEHLTWATGQMLLRAAYFVRRHKQLFAAYITNFGCGPDSFLVTYFRQIMQDKPSLTIEIDSHTADAGVNTRIEAFLDIVWRYRALEKQKMGAVKKEHTFTPARMAYRKKKPYIVSSDNKSYNIYSPKVRVLIPSMGDLGSSVLAAVFERIGIAATALDVPDNEVLMLGRGHTSCKECLPLILCCGSLLKYHKAFRRPEEILLYFMPAGSGNCRFSQYSPFLENLIRRTQLTDTAVFSLTSENGYVGFGTRFNATVFKAVIISDCFDDIRNTLIVLAKDPEYGLRVFNQQWQHILRSFRSSKFGTVERQLRKSAQVLRTIPLKYPMEEAKFVSLLGEIFVRKEVFSRQGLVERLTGRGIIPRTASVTEWIYYVDILVKKGIISGNFNMKKRLEFMLKHSFQYMVERRLKNIIAGSGLYMPEQVDIKKLIEYGEHFIPLELTGEPIIVVGAALSEILHSVCGVVSIGPFTCLQSRVSEAILSKEMNLETKRRISRERFEHIEGFWELPFLAIEVDGNAFSPIMEAKFEAFCLQAQRLHTLMQAHTSAHRKR